MSLFKISFEISEKPIAIPFKFKFTFHMLSNYISLAKLLISRLKYKKTFKKFKLFLGIYTQILVMLMDLTKYSLSNNH